MISFKILSLTIFTLFLLSINIGLSYSQKPIRSDPFSNTLSSPLGTASSSNNLMPTSQSPFSHNIQFLGNSHSFPLNNLSFSSSLPPLQPSNNLMPTSQSPFSNNTISSNKNIGTVVSIIPSKSTNNDAILHTTY